MPVINTNTHRFINNTRFWSIKRNNNTVVVFWGKVDPRCALRSKTYNFVDIHEAHSWYRNKIQSKLNRGYMETR